MTNRNPILDELRETREALLTSAGGTLAGLVTQLQQDERDSERTVLDAEELRKKGRAGGRARLPELGSGVAKNQSSPANP